MAIGSKRSLPTSPAWATVVSEDMIEPMNVPCSQSRASCTSGTIDARRPPNMIAEIGTPRGSSHSSAIDGHWAQGTVKRALGWAAVLSDSGVQSSPRQSMACTGGSPVMPSHQISPSSVLAQLVKTVLRLTISIALGFVRAPVPGATPKKPDSGLTAYKRPSEPNFIQAMSSPIVSTFQSGRVGMTIARLVLPQALGNAPAMYLTSPSGEVTFKISMCSAIQPSSRAMIDAIRNAKHFLPSRALPPYPEPKD